MFIARHIALDLIRSLLQPIGQIARHDRALAQQLRNAGSSVHLNLAEGNHRVGRDRMHFFRIAAGSAAEVRAVLEVAIAWQYIDEESAAETLRYVDRELGLLWGLTHRRR